LLCSPLNWFHFTIKINVCYQIKFFLLLHKSNRNRLRCEMMRELSTSTHKREIPTNTHGPLSKKPTTINNMCRKQDFIHRLFCSNTGARIAKEIFTRQQIQRNCAEWPRLNGKHKSRHREKIAQMTESGRKTKKTSRAGQDLSCEYIFEAKRGRGGCRRGSVSCFYWMVMSEHERKFSWGPQPRAPEPSGQTPHELPVL
jgi:hypothetical protein